MAVNIRSDAQRVQVEDREDVGYIIDGGKNLGSTSNVYCYGIYFPDTGEVKFYETSRVVKLTT